MYLAIWDIGHNSFAFIYFQISNKAEMVTIIGVMKPHMGEMTYFHPNMDTIIQKLAIFFLKHYGFGEGKWGALSNDKLQINELLYEFR